MELPSPSRWRLPPLRPLPPLLPVPRPPTRAGDDFFRRRRRRQLGQTAPRRQLGPTASSWRLWHRPLAVSAPRRPSAAARSPPAMGRSALEEAVATGRPRLLGIPQARGPRHRGRVAAPQVPLHPRGRRAFFLERVYVQRRPDTATVELPPVFRDIQR
ncbi:hypothetical protein I4F81_012567 [Pyropia yezoensis]|uniref:Uncharacterized protein n=1 Tax=Pyropia yezoensis TaxID=2788 RepID=A0ACC3CIR1_PYRYE|nr:hypothetical protein I4F81_012567 [Neopyropia yezoensis]